MLKAELVTWGESKMELLENAIEDACNAGELISAAKMTTDDSSVIRLLDMASRQLKNARSRIEVCHNELDCEREAMEPVARD